MLMFVIVVVVMFRGIQPEPRHRILIFIAEVFQQAGVAKVQRMRMFPIMVNDLVQAFTTSSSCTSMASSRRLSKLPGARLMDRRWRAVRPRATSCREV